MPIDPTPDLASLPGSGNITETDPLSINALDDAFRAAGGDPKKPEEPLAKIEVEPVEAPPVKKDEKPPVKTKVEADEPPVKELPDSGDVLDAAEKAARTPKPEVEAPEPKKEAPVAEKDELDSIELPGNVKPNTVKSFDRVKEVARERIALVLKEKEELSKEIETLKAKVVEGLPKEVEAELKAGREFRAKLDVESDPTFLTYDKSVADNTESIYAKLRATPGIDEKQIQAIKDLGGASEVDWDGPGIKLPGQVRRYIESKLVENEGLLEKKNKAISDAKSNAEQYLSTRREEQKAGSELANKAVEKEIEDMLPSFKWFSELKAKDGASTEEKAAIDAHNKVIADSRATFKDAVTDNSPTMRAVLAVGYAQLLKTRVDFSLFKASTSAKEAAFAEEKKALTKELDETKALLGKIKKSSTTRLRDTPAEDDSAGKSKKVDISTPGVDALDRHLAEIQAARE